MSDEYSVDLTELDSIVTRLSNLAKFLGDHLTALDQQVTTLRADSWDSAGAAAYEDAHRQWLSGAQEFAQGVTDMSVAARNAHGQYTAAIGANTQMFGGR
ncbi:WXG100 family type VII secretion target [Nocardia acidivorans]|uniref:WXG100 family type VII secretion target n=1 Tax=Nocardia acidivorans TaxID=404580 RepID=UPI00083694DA|nr:WXG100 family type VII secretion target [Nocardia acidivorans]